MATDTTACARPATCSVAQTPPYRKPVYTARFPAVHPPTGTTPFGRKGLRVAKQGYLAPNDHGGAGGQVTFSYCRSLYALALKIPPKLSSHIASRPPSLHPLFVITPIQQARQSPRTSACGMGERIPTDWGLRGECRRAPLAWLPCGWTWTSGPPTSPRPTASRLHLGPATGAGEFHPEEGPQLAWGEPSRSASGGTLIPRP